MYVGVDVYACVCSANREYVCVDVWMGMWVYVHVCVCVCVCIWRAYVQCVSYVRAMHVCACVCVRVCVASSACVCICRAGVCTYERIERERDEGRTEKNEKEKHCTMCVFRGPEWFSERY